MDPEWNVVTRAGAGCRDAFDELVRRYRRPVYNLVRALSGGDSDAEDLVQDIFVRAYRAIGSFRGDSTFRSWLFQISVNVVRSHRGRRHLRGASGQLSLQMDVPLEEIPADDDVEEAFGRRRAIDRALATLPEDMRVLVVLRDVHGLKYEEIARIVKLPRGTVDSRLFRARRRLRPLLAPYMSRAAAQAAAAEPTDEPETDR